MMTARQYHAKALRAERLSLKVWGIYRTAGWEHSPRRAALLERYTCLRRCFISNLFSLTELAERFERGR